MRCSTLTYVQMIVLAISCIMLLLCQAGHYIARQEQHNQNMADNMERTEQPGILQSPEQMPDVERNITACILLLDTYDGLRQTYEQMRAEYNEMMSAYNMLVSVQNLLTDKCHN